MNQSSPSIRRLIAGMTLAGFVSGILSMISLEILSNVPRLRDLRLVVYAPGAIFGVVVSAYYAIFFRARSWARLLSFAAASTGAYFSAVTLSVYTVVSLRSADWSKEALFQGAMFLGGMVGALVVLTAGQLLLSSQRKWKAIFARAILWSLAGGALGVAGFALGGSLGKVLWLGLHALGLPLSDATLEEAARDENVNFYSLIVLWQTSMAPILGWLVSKSSAAQAKPQSAVSSA